MATLHRLATAPDLVDQAYRALVDAPEGGPARLVLRR